MNLIGRYCSAVLAVVLLSSPIFAQERPRIVSEYDLDKNRTTVKMAPVKISGDKDKYHSLYMSPSFSYSGQEPTRPETIDFELQTVVKGKLRVDLYVVFIVDNETIF